MMRRATPPRITSTTHHSGFGAYGVLTGRGFATAHCRLRHQKIRFIEQWSVCDDLGIITGLGYEIEDVVSRLAEQDRIKVLGAGCLVKTTY